MTPRFAWKPVGIVAGVVFALLAAFAGRYGPHRDELYYLVAGRHPAWGYDDQPSFTPLLTRVMDAISANLTVLRLPSALAMSGVVLLVAGIAYEMGGDRRRQVLAALLAAVAPFLTAVGHLVSTSTFDYFFAALLSWLIARWVRTGRDRLLIYTGLVLGIGLNNKALLAFVAGALVLGFPALLRRRAFWLGALLALALWLPDLIWQAQHGWPQLEMADAIRADEPGGGRILLLPMQFALFGVLTAPIWIAGIVRCWRSRFRGFAVAYVTLIAGFLALGGQIYYPAGGYPAILAAGALSAADWVGESVSRRWLVITALGLTGVTAVLVGLPVYPVSAVGSSVQAALNPDALETVGWPELTGTVRTVYLGLPPAERATALIYTGNYGEAGAIARYGPDLPPVYSGHNAFWRWGPPPERLTGPVIVVGWFDEARLRERCGELTLATRFDNGLNVPNDEQGTGVWLCRKPVKPWSEAWPELRHLG